jgi:lipopolysaccharide heptosyltransferase I
MAEEPGPRDVAKWMADGTGISGSALSEPEHLAARARPSECMEQSSNQGPRILIVRLSAMGDLIHSVPVLNALRGGMPGAFIGWVAEGRNADLLEGHPALDRLIRVPRHWLKSPQAVFALRRELRALRFDITLDLQSLTKSAVAAWLSGARRRIGFGGKLGRELSRLLNHELFHTSADHVVDRYLSMLEALEISNPAVRWDFPERDVDASFAQIFLRDQQFEAQRFAILNPAAGWVSKRWPTNRYGELARYLARHQQLPSLIVWGAPSERSLARQVVDVGGSAAVLAPPTNMTQLAALARRAAIFVGSDTGPLHLAVAVGTPSISLHGTTPAAQCGAYGPRNRSLQVVYDNSQGKRRQADTSAMEAITTEIVCQACRELLR